MFQLCVFLHTKLHAIDCMTVGFFSASVCRKLRADDQCFFCVPVYSLVSVDYFMKFLGNWLYVLGFYALLRRQFLLTVWSLYNFFYIAADISVCVCLSCFRVQSFSSFHFGSIVTKSNHLSRTSAPGAEEEFCPLDGIQTGGLLCTNLCTLFRAAIKLLLSYISTTVNTEHSKLVNEPPRKNVI